MAERLRIACGVEERMGIEAATPTDRTEMVDRIFGRFGPCLSQIERDRQKGRGRAAGRSADRPVVANDRVDRFPGVRKAASIVPHVEQRSVTLGQDRVRRRGRTAIPEPAQRLDDGEHGPAAPRFGSGAKSEFAARGREDGRPIRPTIAD
ncbi:MAG TPA: hypothetical protein DCQ98_17565 [Planctomycetaceae bacterium]|nr:hypothetical protein [Planctomycetaceae bacterium]